MKNTKTKFSHRVIAIFFTMTFLQTLIPYNQLWANNNGPNAPEAGAFEPVDATDMVNLVTGDMSYVLPLLNVPSPEGGYPLALSYHAGIAMDQEASWVGLGWNLNPGAINRSINGYADDYYGSLLSEYFYDEGGKESVYSLSVGYSYGASVGVGFSWGSNRSLGGFVSVGVGIPVGQGQIGVNARAGTDGSSIGIGYSSPGGLSLGVSLNSQGTVGFSAGFDNNGTGFSVGASTDGAYSAGFNTGSKNKNGNSFSMDFNLSSSGVGISASSVRRKEGKVVGGAGIGLSVASNNAIGMGDYTVKSGGYNIPVVVPTPIGVFSLSFGKQKIRYFLSKNEYNFVTGPLNFDKNIKSKTGFRIKCQKAGDCGAPCGLTTTYNNVVLTAEERDQILEEHGTCRFCSCSVQEVDLSAFMDIYELSLASHDFNNNTETDQNNVTFPSYDKYNVQAQGLSGNISAKQLSNGGLFGLSDTETNKDYKVSYASHSDIIEPNAFRFRGDVVFYFENEISTYTEVPTIPFGNSTTYGRIGQYNIGNSYYHGEKRKAKANYIEHFTNDEIVNNYNALKNLGYLKPSSIGFSRNSKPENGIGAFKITSADGKTYHYSLPVYNHETVTRTFGHISQRPNEQQAYIEKRQLEPYATHWLLTAVTGPDYIDNGDGVAGEGDLGYWTSFNYGKWSDAFVWKAPYGKEYIENADDTNIKTWIKGRKQLYYLNSIKTRTHTAVFVKSPRNDAKSVAWSYRSVDHIDNKNQNSGNYKERFNIPSQRQLKLDKIILLKNSDANNLVTSGSNENQTSQYLYVRYNDSDKEQESAAYNSYENVFNPSDVSNEILTKAIKVIDFRYAAPGQSLAKHTPNTQAVGEGRLTLNKVYFNGKANTSMVPPYQFEYQNRNYTYRHTDQGAWGYHKTNPAQWSLNEVTTPQGGKIKVHYEDHEYFPVHKNVLLGAEYSSAVNEQLRDGINSDGTDLINGLELNGEGDSKITILHNTHEFQYQQGNYPIYDTGYLNFKLETTNSYNNFRVGDKVDIKFQVHFGLAAVRYPSGIGSTPGKGTIINKVSAKEFIIKTDIPAQWGEMVVHLPKERSRNYCFLDVISSGTNNVEAGPRVKEIETTDGINTYRTAYQYTNNNQTSGYVSYLPFAPYLEKEIPYSSELPSPKVMYEYVTTEFVNKNGISNGKVRYKFNVLKERSDNHKVKYGDFYRIDYTNTNVNNTTANTSVSIREYTVKDNLSAIGQLLEVSTFNNQNQLINKTVNNYYNSNEIPEKIGVTQESYQTYKEIDYDDSSTKNKWFINSSTRIKYPNILESTVQYSGNHEYETFFRNYNTISGQSLEQLTSHTQGGALKTETVPAFTIAEYSGMEVNNQGVYNGNGMGSKAYVTNNKNMLTQTAATITSISKSSGGFKPINVDITTWKNSWTYRNYTGTTSTPSSSNQKIWRKHKSYSWKGELDSDGGYVGYSGDFDNFNWGINASQSNSKWVNTSTIDLYDHYSVPLQTTDINGDKAATKMGDKDTKVEIVGNASYTEMFYSGAEYYDGNYIGKEIQGNVYKNSTKAHTGKYSLHLNSGNQGYKVIMKSGQHQAGKYKVSVWVDKANASKARVHINGSTKTFNGESVNAGNWTLLNHYEDLSVAEEIIYVTAAGGSIYADDFRVLPVASAMTSYVYNDWDELTHIIGPNNLATKYEYDAAGRLIRIYNEVIDVDQSGFIGGFKLIKEMEYNYKRIAEVDTNGNGTIDPDEDPEPELYLSLGISDFNAPTTTVTAYIGNGSGDYEYRWASGSSTNLSYGGWTNNNSITISTSCTLNGRKYYKCLVKDKITGKTKEATGTHQRQDCDGDGPGDILISPNQQ